MKKKDNYTFALIVLGVGLVIALLVYLFTIGKVDILDNKKNGPSMAEKKKAAIHNYNRLIKIIAEKEALKKKLNKSFNKVYFIVRLVLALFYVGSNAVTYIWIENLTIDDLINYNQIVLFSLLLLNFVANGSIANTTSIIRYFKRELEIRIYKQHININNEIDGHKKEVEELAVVITQMTN